MRLINRLFLALLSCALSVGVFAQTQDSTVVAAKDSVAPKKTKVFLEHANTLSFDKERNAEAQVLNGDVCFRHDSSYMYCDSAYFFEQTNSLEAFSNVRMEQGDTLFVYGNYLFYDGNTQIAYLRENVRMENGQVTLFTDSLNYERIPDIGYYFDGGLIVDSLNQLSSFYGQYSPSTKLAIFNDSVRLENEQFTLYSDTLHYNTDSKIATILGPSIIVSDHDFRAHLNILNQLMKNQEYSAAEEYLEKITEQQTDRLFLVNTHHPILDALFNTKAAEATQKKISIDFEVNDLSNLPFDASDIVVLLSNLLDNAIEACQRYDKGDKTIHVMAVAQQDFFISVRNTSEPVTIINSSIPTTKPEPQLHGFGLANIRLILEKYSGEYTMFYENGWFQFTADIPLTPIS